MIILVFFFYETGVADLEWAQILYKDRYLNYMDIKITTSIWPKFRLIKLMTSIYACAILR